jgi:hypothetical protein
MANLASGVSGKGKPKTGGTADEGAGTEGSKEEEGVNTTDSRHSLPAAENLLNREFRASGPGEKWVS